MSTVVYKLILKNIIESEVEVQFIPIVVGARCIVPTVNEKI